MNSLYSENNAFANLKELMEELVLLETNSMDLVDKELDKYIVEGDVGQVIHQVHECINIKYYDADNFEQLREKSIKRQISEDTDGKTHILPPVKNSKSTSNIDLRNIGNLDGNIAEHEYKDDIDLNSKDVSLVLDKSNNDISKSGLNLNRDESVSLIDVHIDDMDSELLDMKNSNDESMNDQSISNIQSTCLLSKNQGLKKNASFFKKNPQNRILDTNNPYFPSEAREIRHGFSTSTNANNLVFLPESYRKGELTQSLYQKTPHPDTLPNQRDRFTISHAKEKQPSWSEQDNPLYSSKLAKSPVRRPTLTNRFAPISSRQAGIESETEVNLSRMNINDHAVPQIITEIMKNKKVKAINLSHNSITEIGFEQLLKKLSGHPTLERVYLMNNYLDDSVFVKLEQWAKKLKKINYFNLQNCAHFKNMIKIKKYVNSLAKSGIRIDI